MSIRSQSKIIKISPNNNVEFRGDNEYKEVGGNIYSNLADTLKNMGLPRLFLILSFLIYGIIAFSKGGEGVETSDITLSIFYIVVILLLFLTLSLIRRLFEINWLVGFQSVFYILKYNIKLIFSFIILISIILCVYLYKNEIVLIEEQVQKAVLNSWKIIIKSN